ncbi:hypothetical protein OS176_09470 [Xanthomonadaceae bacterium XH05]|nr:hypothetical protein [Xanthomonadaceae bacterium XH05]
MRVSCPCCATEFPIEAGMIEADGKRLAAMLAGMEPALARAVLGYLRLFKPAKQGLRLARAVKIVQELNELVDAGRVCADERAGVWRQAPVALWVAGIEQLLVTPPAGLPLGGHNYLRKVVFTLAEKHEAEAEKRLEENRRAGRHRTGPVVTQKDDRLTTAIQHADHMLYLGVWTREQRDARVAEAKAKDEGKK